MAEITVADGETLTIADGETKSGGPLVLEGTVSLEGTLALEETPVTATTAAGATVAPNLAGEKAIGPASAAAGATVTLATIDGAISLRRVSSFSVDETRRDEFDTQGVGETE